MSNISLYVPIILEALIVSKNSAPIADFSPDYSDLTDIPFGKYATRLFGTKSELSGIHLHWTMPDSLLHGIHNKDKNGDYNINFPDLPNRWIIQRVCSNDNKIKRKAWIIESDFVTNYPSISLGEYNRTSIPTFVFKDGVWKGAGPEGQIYGYLGNIREYGTENIENGYYLPKLTAVGAGDTSFSAFYQKSKSVFGFYDDMKDTESGFYSYILTGYYDDLSKDPLYMSTKESLEQLKWLYDGSSELAKKTICHSILKQVEWKGPNENYKSNIPKEDIDVYIGNTSSETLSKVLQNRLPEIKGFERVLNILQNNLLEDMDSSNTDALIEIEEKLHEKQFSSEEQGNIWQLRNLEGRLNSSLINHEIYCKINELNELQKELNLFENELESIKNEIYFAWWKYVLIETDPWGSDKENYKKKFPNWYKEFYEAKKADSNDFVSLIYKFIDKLKNCENEILKNKNKIKEIFDFLSPQLHKNSLKLSFEQKDRFYTSDAPVLMFCGNGVKRAYKQGFQNDCENEFLRCRIKVIEGMVVKINNKDIVVSAKDVVQICSVLPKELQNDIENVFAESVLLSEDCAYSIAKKAFDIAKIPYSTQQLNSVVSQVKRNQKEKCNYIGVLPGDISINYWKQPWSPLFMEWRVNITPVRTNIKKDNSFSKFSLEEIDFEYNKNEISEYDDPIEIQGATIITPHAVNNMSYEIKKLINNHQKNSNSYNNLKKAADTIEKMDILSQRMDGFNEALIMRDNLPCLPIYYSTDSSDVNKLIKDITDVLDISFFSPRVENLESRFLPVRSGFMSLLEIWLVDSFGQLKKIDLKQNNIHISESLQYKEKDNTVFLRPRFIQPCSISFKWIPSIDVNALKMLTESIDNSTTPIFGFIIPNFLDKNLQIYNADGNLLGFLQSSGQGVSWKKILPSNIDIDNIKSQHLRFFVNRIIGENNSALNDLLLYLDDVSSKTAPIENNQFFQLCFGKPLALATASVKVLSKGYPPYVQWFKKSLVCNKFNEEYFKVRFGDKRKLNDGFMGFFAGGEEAETYKNLFVPEFNRSFKSEFIIQNNTIETNLISDPVFLTFLFDPSGYISVTTGFLPSKKILLDAQYYQKQMENSEMFLKTAPILSEINDFEIPIPGGMTDKWRFTYINSDKTISEIKNIHTPNLLPSTIRRSIFEGYLNKTNKED